MGQGRFLVIALTTVGMRARGTCFEAHDGSYLIIQAAQTLDRTIAMAAAAGLGGRVYAVRPCWSLPAEQWVAADPDFWSSGTAAR
jgi:hypothetical protein